MHKRISLRIVEELAGRIAEIAQKRGISVNALISEMAWDFVEAWKQAHDTKEAEK